MTRFHAFASAAALLCYAAMAARMKMEVHDEHADPNGGVAAVTVCEDDAIWDKIMASPDVGSIRAIPWKEISDSMANYLSNEAVIIGNLENEVDKLKEEIKRKKAAEVSDILSDQKIQELISESVAAEGSFGSLENAKTSACGKPGKKPRVPFDSQDVATEKIVALARDVLSTGAFKSDKLKFTTVCKTLLEAGDDELENYCGEVCFELAEAVQGVSNQYSNSKKETAKLEKILAEKSGQLLDAKGRQGQCLHSKQNLEGFQTYLESLDAEIVVRHEAVRKAERDLDNALWALEDLEKKLAEQRELEAAAANLLTGTSQAVQAAKEALAAVKKDEEQLLELIAVAKTRVSELREQLANMKEAVDATLEIKKYVSATALKMGYYVDVAVREPVRQIGLVEETNVWDYFTQDVAADQCSTAFKHHLSDFHEYCTGPAMTAFEKIKHFVDLTPLCTLDDESKIAGEGDEAVQTRIGLLTQDLTGVQTWLDPFKGTGMTTEKEIAKVEMGEPEGLRQVVGVYGMIKFYTGYMKEWKVGRGIFHDLLNKLTEETQELEGDLLYEVEKVLPPLDEALIETSKRRVEAQARLDAALAAEQAALEGKNELAKVVASLETQVVGAQNMLTDLEGALKKAIKMYKEARATLVSKHTEGKDGILALSELHTMHLGE